MAKARIVYDGDWVYTTKVKKNLKLLPGIEQAIDNIPGVIDNADSESTSDALSAHMGKVLQDQITDLQWIWTFLSGWDCTTWLPITDPREDPYVYKPGNYYIVVNVGTWDNFKPHWSQYQRGTASITVELDAVQIDDKYMYDWADWVRIPNWGQTIAVDSELSTSSRRPVENRVITNELNKKLEMVYSQLPPVEHDVLWYDNVNFVINYWNDDAWKPLWVVNGWSTEPQGNITGNLWYDIDNNVLRVYRVWTWWKDLAYWTTSDTAPSVAGNWHLWYDTTAGVLKYKSWNNWNTVWTVDNSALSSNWSWDTTQAPSKNAVYNALVNVATLMWVSINDIINPPQP